MLYIGIDPAVRRSGWAIVDQDGARLASGCVGHRPGAYYGEVKDALAAALPPAIGSARIYTLGAVEGQHVNVRKHNKHTAIELSRAAGLWEAALFELGAVDVWRPQPSAWRSVLKIDRHVPKRRYVEWCADNLSHTPANDDEAEALCIASALRLRRLGEHLKP